MKRTSAWGVLLFGLWLPVAGACASLPWGGPIPRDGATYQGYLHMDGQDLWTTVRLASSSEGLAGQLNMRDGPSASGVGEISGRALFLGLDYDGDCGGRIVLTGEFGAGGSEITGLVKAQDCTGRMTGSFLLKTRSDDVTGPVDS